MRRSALLFVLLALGCAPGPKGRDVAGVSALGDNHAEWQAHFKGNTLKTIHERSSSAKNVYWFDKGRLRLYDSQSGRNAPRQISVHVLFDSAGRVTKFSKRENGRAVAIEPAEAQGALARAAFLAVEARKVAGVPAAH